MTSHPPRQCCITGHLHTGTPRGTISTIAGVRTYIAEPPTTNPPPKTALILMSDALGIDFPNTQLIADQLAQQSYLVLAPDVLGTAAIPFPPPPSFDLDEWCRDTMPQPSAVDALYNAVITHLRTEQGIEKVGGVGYCFGARYVVRFLSPSPSPSGPEPGPPGLDAGFIAHPSFVSASEVRAVSRPLSIAAAARDEIFDTEKRRETEGILLEKENEGLDWEMCVYGGMEHGFATKGDLSGKKGRGAKERAFRQAVEWLGEFLGE